MYLYCLTQENYPGLSKKTKDKLPLAKSKTARSTARPPLLGWRCALVRILVFSFHLLSSSRRWRHMQGRFPYSVLPFRATSYFRTACWNHGILPYWLFYHVIPPYCLPCPWHTFVLQARSTSFSRSGINTLGVLSFSVWRPCRSAVRLQCLK